MWLIGVVKLAEQNEKKTRHLRSARQWLSQAEESFEEDREVRGELNLFLAQAELQRAKETGLNRGWLRKYPAIRHGLAAVVAMTLVSVAFGVYNQSNEGLALQQSAAPSIVSPAMPSVTVEKPKISLQTPAALPTNAPKQQLDEPIILPAPLRLVTQEKRPEPISAQNNEQRSPVSSEEMKRLIRAAGKSLRGE